MRTKEVRPIYVGQTTKVAWAVLLTLVVVLILGAFVAPAGVAAKAGAGTPSDSLATKVRQEYTQYRGRGGTSASESLATKVRVDYAQYRGRGGFAKTNPLADNPELMYARAYSLGQGIAFGQNTATSLLADNPELVYSQAYSLGQGSGVAACVLGQDYATLAANPELVYTAKTGVC